MEDLYDVEPEKETPRKRRAKSKRVKAKINIPEDDVELYDQSLDKEDLGGDQSFNEFDELPNDVLGRTLLCLRVHAIPPSLQSQIIAVLRLHPEAQDNPNNFANLLAHILGSTPNGKMHIGKIGLLTSEVFGTMRQEQQQYYAGYGAGPQQPAYGYSGFPAQSMTPMYPPYPSNSPMMSSPPGNHLDRYLEFLMSREVQKTQKSEVPDEIEQRMKTLESNNAKLAGLLEKLISKDEENKLESRLSRIEDLARGNTSQSSTEWVRMALEEREKRMSDLMDAMDRRNQEVVTSLASQLQESRDALINAREQAGKAREEALREEEERYSRYIQRVQQEGFHPRAKTSDEREMDLLENQIAPAVLGESKRIGQSLEKLVSRMTPSYEQQFADEQPVYPEDAAVMNELMQLENEIAAR